MKMYIGLLSLLAFIVLNSSAVAYTVDSKTDKQTVIEHSDYSGLGSIFHFDSFTVEHPFSVQFTGYYPVLNECGQAVESKSHFRLFRFARDGLIRVL